MKTPSTYTTNKKQICFEIDSELRSFSATCKAIIKFAKSNPERFNEVANMDGITVDMFNMDYIREHLSKRFNTDGKLCALKVVTLDEVSNWDGFEVVTLDEKAVVYVPKFKFTTNEVYNLVKNAKNAKKAVEKAVEKAKKAVEREQREREKLSKLEKEVERMREKLAKN